MPDIHSVPDPLGGEVLGWDVDDTLHVVSERAGPVAVFSSHDAAAILLSAHSWAAVWEVTDKGALVVRDPLRAGKFTTHEPGRWGWIGHVQDLHHGPTKEFG